MFRLKKLYQITVEFEENRMVFYFKLSPPIVDKKLREQKIAQLMDDFLRTYTPNALAIVDTYNALSDTDSDDDSDDDLTAPLPPMNPMVEKNNEPPYILYRHREKIQAKDIHIVLNTLQSTRFALQLKDFTDVNKAKLSPDEQKKNHPSPVKRPMIWKNPDGTHAVSLPIEIPKKKYVMR